MDEYSPHERAHYILPAGSFGQRPPFQDRKRKPSSRELPVEDVSMLLCITPERTLFLDEIYNNFLNLTLVDQQEIFVDFLLKELKDCLLRGVASSIIINDVGRLHNLDNTSDPKAAFILEGDFGILLSPSEEGSYNDESTRNLGSTISTPRLTTSNGPSSTVPFREPFTLPRHDDLANIHRGVSCNFENKVCLLAPFSGNTFRLVNVTYHQSLPAVVSRCTKYPHNSASAPAGYRFVVQRQTASMKVSFCRRVGQYISYCSAPFTFRVTKISLATERNCVSLMIFKVHQPVEVRRGLAHEGKRHTFQKFLPITCFAENVDEGPSLPLPIHSSQMTSNDRVINPPQRLHSNRLQNAADPIKPPEANHRPASTYASNLFGKTSSIRRGCLNKPKHTKSPTTAQKRQDATNNDIVQAQPVPVFSQRLTPKVPQIPVLPWANRAPGGKAAAAPPSKPDFDQHNQQTDAAKNQPSMVAQPRTPGQQTTILGAVAICPSNFGQVNAATNFNDPFGYGPTTNVGFFQPFEFKHAAQTTRNPAMGVIGGAVNTQTPPCIGLGPHAGARATVWNTSKPCSQGRNVGVTSYGQNGQSNSHHLLNSKKSNHLAAASLRNINNNFGLCPTQQAAVPGFMLWGTTPMIPKSLMKAIPKALAKGPSAGNKEAHHKYHLPPSCPLIPWSDLEDVNDRIINKPKILGSGAFGIVKLMKQTSTGRLCAVKINRDDVDKKTAIKNFQMEVDILTSLKNLECVPELFGATEPGNNTQLPVVVQEFIGDPKTLRSVTLQFALEARVLSVVKATRVALRICEAVKDIHGRKLLHCDLKIDNIMMEPNFIRKDDPKIKIIDFGLSVKMDDKPRYQYNSRDEIPWILKHCGQIAPEVVRGEKPFNVVSEVYSIGIVFKALSYRSGGFLRKLGKDCANKDYSMRPSLEDVIQKIKTHLASNQL